MLEHLQPKPGESRGPVTVGFLLSFIHPITSNMPYCQLSQDVLSTFPFFVTCCLHFQFLNLYKHYQVDTGELYPVVTASHSSISVLSPLCEFFQDLVLVSLSYFLHYRMHNLHKQCEK